MIGIRMVTRKYDFVCFIIFFFQYSVWNRYFVIKLNKQAFKLRYFIELYILYQNVFTPSFIYRRLRIFMNFQTTQYKLNAFKQFIRTVMFFFLFFDDIY